MNIGFLYNRTFPPGVGSSVHGYQLARGLAERGHKLFRWYHGSDSNPVVTHMRGRQLLSFLRKIDLLYVRVDYRARAKFAWLRRLALRKLPVVWELNGLPREILFEGGTQRDVDRAVSRMRRLARHVDAAIGVTPSICDFLQSCLRIPNVACIANGSDPSQFVPGVRDLTGRAPLRVVWMGSRCPWHDTTTIVAAAKILAARKCNARFALLGQYEHDSQELPKNVEALGVVPYADLGKTLGSYHVGIQLFHRQDGEIKGGSPLKLFDYMSCGLAVLAQDACQTGQVLREHDAGFYVTADPEDVAAKIVRLEADRELCHRLGRNGRQAVLDYYNWDRVGAQTEEMLLSTVSGTR